MIGKPSKKAAAGGAKDTGRKGAAKGDPKGTGASAARGGAPSAFPYAEDAVATRLLRETYTRERHYFLMRIILLMGVALIGAIGAIWYLATIPPVYRYFATDTEGKIKELTPLNRPIQSLNEILNWTTNSITQAYTFSFANYRQELQAARNNFTDAGWKGFEKALAESQTLKSVTERRFVATAVPTGAPVVAQQGLVEGRYAWKIQLPIIVTYQSANDRATQDLLITAVVVRRPETEHPKGLGIAQIIAE